MNVYKKIIFEYIKWDKNISDKNKILLCRKLLEYNDNIKEFILENIDVKNMLNIVEYMGELMLENDKKIIPVSLPKIEFPEIEKTPTGLRVAAIASIPGIIYLTYKISKDIYNNLLSKSARYCIKEKQVSRERFNICVRKFKTEALKKQIQFLNKSKTQCLKTKDPKKCKQKLDEKIEKLRVNLNKK